MNVPLLNRLLPKDNPLGAYALGLICSLESPGRPVPDAILETAAMCKTYSQVLDLYATVKTLHDGPGETALEPCPFCGGSNLKSGHRDGVAYVDCKNCHSTCEFYHGDNLIERWNRRDPPPLTDEQQINQLRAEHGVFG